MKKQLKLAVTAFVVVASLVLSAFPLAQVALAQGTVSKIALKGSTRFPNAIGTAKYKVDGTEREFQVEVEHIKPLAGKRLYVYVNGVRAGSFLVSSLGTGRMNRNTIRGQAVPMIVTGSMVTVRTGTGVLVASGQF